MSNERIEKLKLEYTGQLAEVDSDRPELARWAGSRGRVRTINYNGRALVQFDDPDQGWHEIELDDLKVIDPPSQETNGENGVADNAPANSNGQSNGEPVAAEKKPRLSRLELARQGMPSPPTAD